MVGGNTADPVTISPCRLVRQGQIKWRFSVGRKGSQKSAPSTLSNERPRVQSWTFRHQFVSDNDTFPKDETEARRQVAAAKANREKQFGELVTSYKRGGYGLDSWRVTLTEPVKCSNESGSYNRPFVRCTQRVDYAVVSTDAPSSDVLLYGYYPY